MGEEKKALILSIDESIQRLKAEIIAQDWSLSQKRIDLLEAAFTCLKNRFKTRKAAFAILTMARSVLDYVKKKGGDTPSATIDFLKEAMAHIVSLYENRDFDPEREEKLFRGLYSRFAALKQKIQTERRSAPAAQPVQLSTDRHLSDDQQNAVEIFSTTSLKQLEKKITSLHNYTDINLEKGEVEQLLHGLQTSLQQAEEVGSAIRDMLNDLNLLKEKSDQTTQGNDNKGQIEPPVHPQSNHHVSPDVAKPTENSHRPIKTCPATELREIILGSVPVYIRESNIALIRDISPGKRKSYLKNSNVPLKDFSRFMKSLAKEFKGPLSKIPNKKLKKLTLPIMVPVGLNLPETVDEEGEKLIIVSNGHWNGALICSGIHHETRTMVKFMKSTNGDTAGIGYSVKGSELSLLNIVSVLRREGFLTMI